MVIIGTGTGRCGTKSLARLLIRQRRSASSHELSVGGKDPVKALNISNKEFVLNKFKKHLKRLKQPNKCVVGFYWLWSCGDLIEKYDAKIIYMFRDKKEVINSS